MIANSTNYIISTELDNLQKQIGIILPVVPFQEEPKNKKGKPMFNGKSPSYYDEDGKPALIQWEKITSQSKADEYFAKNHKNKQLGRGIIITNPDICVIDIDCKDDRSLIEPFLDELLKTAPQLENSYTEKTPSGGYHLIVKVEKVSSIKTYTSEKYKNIKIGEILSKSGRRFMVTVPTIGYEIVSNKPPVTITSIDALGIIEYTEKHKKTLSGLNRNKRYRMLINQNEPICSNNKQKDYTELVKHLYSIRQRRKTIGDYDNYIDDIDRVLKAVGEKMFPDNRDEPTQIISSIHETNYEEEDNKFSDTEMVDLLLDSNIDKEIKYSESESCWYRFDNESNYWVKCPNSSRINNLIKERLRELGIGKINNYHIKNCEQILRGEPRIIVDNFKPKLNLLPLVDKVLDVSEKPVLVLENSPNLYLNYNVGYTYSDSSDCPKTQAYLLESVGGIHEQVETLRAFLNCIVLGRYYLERFLHLDGSGGAGKSTFTRLATALVGEKMTYSTKLKQLEDNKFEVAALRNKKLCLVNDSDKYAGEVSTLKNITGCDSVRFEVKGKQQGEESFTYTGMVIITSNEALRFKDYTSGIKRRKLVIQFHNKPTHCKNLINIVDGNLSGELVPELPHVLRWVLDMQDEQVINYIKYTEQHVPSLVLAQREALIDTNPVADWANERLVYEKGSKAFYGDKSKEGTLYHDFCKYVENSGAYSLGKNNFKGVLKDLLTKQVTGLDVYEIKPQNKPCLVNVRLRTDKDNNLPRLLSFDSVDSMDDVKEVNCLNLFDLPSENSNDIEDIV